MAVAEIRPMSGPPAISAAAGRRVAIVQSNYIPWKGYFDMIRRVDAFVLFDDVQFTKRDWRNRNIIKTASGPRWLTIPVATKSRFDQRICDTRIDDPDWSRRHWQSIESAYRRAPGWTAVGRHLARLYEEVAAETSLSRVNRRLIEGLCPMLGLTTPLSWSMDYPSDGRKSERLIAICRAVGASVYLSGPAARAYLDEAAFAAAGIEVAWMDYGHYRPYPQLHGAFDHHLSVIDLLANLGDAAGPYLRAET